MLTSLILILGPKEGVPFIELFLYEGVVLFTFFILKVSELFESRETLLMLSNAVFRSMITIDGGTVPLGFEIERFLSILFLLLLFNSSF